MKVAKFMHTHVITALPTTLLPKLWTLISHKHIHSLPIIDEKKRVVGVVAKEDFLAKLYPSYVEGEEIPADSDDELLEKLERLKKLTASDIMKTNVIFTRPQTNVMRALSRMIVRKVRQLPVLDDDDRLIGMLSKSDVFAGFFKKKLPFSS